MLSLEDSAVVVDFNSLTSSSEQFNDLRVVKNKVHSGNADPILLTKVHDLLIDPVFELLATRITLILIIVNLIEDFTLVPVYLDKNGVV